jgi:hypothetical protein
MTGKQIIIVGAFTVLQQREGWSLRVHATGYVRVLLPSGESGDRFDRGGPVDACVEKASVRATLAPQGSYDTTSATSPTFFIYLSSTLHHLFNYSPLQLLHSLTYLCGDELAAAASSLISR